MAAGALDLDCQLLAWLAARAVDWPKTGVWRAEDTKLFEIIGRRVGQYPDFMNRPYRSTYKSTRVRAYSTHCLDCSNTHIAWNTQ